MRSFFLTCASLLVILAAAAPVSARGRRGGKIFHGYRPEKPHKALLEKGEEEESREEALSTETFGSSESSLFPTAAASTESFFPIDFNSFFRRFGRGSRVKDLFSRVWGDLFGEGDSSGRPANSTEKTESGESGVDSEEDSFLGGFVELLRPWWKGPNVCTREEEFEEDESEERDLFSSLLTSCKDVGNVYKCTMKVGKDGKVKVRSLIYECCHGYTRAPGEKGCPRELELADLFTTVREMNLTKFAEIVETAGLKENFEKENLTLFIPNNDALTAATDTEEIGFVLLDSGDKLQFVKDILLAHAAPGWRYSHEWEDEMLLATRKSGAGIRINYYTYPRPFATANCARITSSDRRTLSGVIHTVDRTLIPAQQTLWEILGQDTRFSIFSSLVDDSLKARLQDPSAHTTVLAFTDDVFAKLPISLQNRIRAKEGCFKNLVGEYLIPHTICSAAVYANAVVRNLAGNYLNATRQAAEGGESGISFHGVPVLAADKMATNGLVHVMDGVILLKHMMSPVEVTKKFGRELLADLLEEENLTEALKGQPYTLFVPPDEKLMDALLGLEGSNRTRLLANHVVNNRVAISPVSRETVVKTLADQEYAVRLEASPFFFSLARSRVGGTVGCRRVTRANVEACGGLVHFLDRPLEVPTQSLGEVLKRREDLSEIRTLLEMARLEERLGQDNFTATLLAPNNDAIEEHLSEEDKRELLDDPEKLRSFLLQHFLTETQCCHDFGSPLWFHRKRHATLAGNHLLSQGVGGGRTVGGASFVECDILATNGHLHVIDRPFVRRQDSLSSLLRRTQLNSRRRRPGDSFWNLDWPF